MAHITQGFEWFRYQIGQSEFAILSAIENDTNYDGLLLIQATCRHQVISSTKVLIFKNK